MSEAEFGGLGFAVGVVRGARSFRVTDDGRLKAMVYRDLWNDGENKAVCHAAVASFMINGQTMNVSMNGTYALTTSAGVQYSWNYPDVTFEKPKRHAMEHCKCGFYMYTDGSDDYRRSDCVSGVVEGYGEVAIGTRGARAGRARIVALCFNAPERLAPIDIRTGSGRIYKWMRRGGKKRALGWSVADSFAPISIFVAGVAVLLGTFLHPAFLAAIPLAAVCLIGLFLASRIGDKAWSDLCDEELERIRRGPLGERGLTTEQVEKVRANYPDIPVFDTFEEMVAAYPPDLGDVTTEEKAAVEKDAA